MARLKNFKGIKLKIILLFIITILFCQVSIYRVAADELTDGPLKINGADLIEVERGKNTTISWQFTVNINERAIYWEITGPDAYEESGWGPIASWTTPVLNEKNAEYEYVCHGYYAKYHVWSTTIVKCIGKQKEYDFLDLRIILYIGIPVILVFGIALIIIIYTRHKKNQDFY